MVEAFCIRQSPLKYCSESGDLVIGRILDRQGEHYRVDINDRFDALLQYYEFEGATKRNRPILENGDLIYTRVSRSSLNSGAFLTCKSANNKKTWSSGQAEFIPLIDGFLINGSVPLSQL